MAGVEDKSPRPERAFVRVDPGMNFGQPHIRGVRTEAIVGVLVAGELAEVVAEDYGLTRAELLLAAWFEARHGSRRYRQLFKAWLGRWEATLGGWNGQYDPAEVPLPTEEEDAT